MIAFRCPSGFEPLERDQLNRNELMQVSYNPLPERTVLWELFDYNPLTGSFHWRDSGTGKRLGAPVGCRHARYGYVEINARASLGSSFKAHRLVLHWLGVDVAPEKQIDHINGDRADNRPWNLRVCDRSQNTANKSTRNKSGFRGVYLRIHNGRPGGYIAQIRHNAVNHYLGSFSTPEEAHAAYRQAAVTFHGEFACFDSVAK